MVILLISYFCTKVQKNTENPAISVWVIYIRHATSLKCAGHREASGGVGRFVLGVRTVVCNPLTVSRFPTTVPLRSHRGYMALQ